MQECKGINFEQEDMVKNIEKSSKKILDGRKGGYLFFGLLLVCFLVILIFGKKKKENDIVSIYVKEKGTDNVFISKDNGVSWSDENIPEYFMTMENKKIRMDEGEALITIQNNSADTLVYGQAFCLFRWDKDMWIPYKTINNFYFTQMAYFLHPNCSCQVQCDLQCYEYEQGKYLLTKEITKKDTDKKIELGVEFVVE